MHRRSSHNTAGTVQGDAKNQILLPVNRAFVVQFSEATQIDSRDVLGRVEHVISGQARHFESLETLLDFIGQLLREANS